MPDPNRPLSDGKLAALKLLKQARDDAEDTGADPRQFAVSKPSLLAAGANESDLRWLVKRRFAERLTEITRRGAPERQFEFVAALSMPDNACFVLSHLGKVYVERNSFERTRPHVKAVAGGSGEQKPAGRPARERIRWNAGRHELLVDGKLAKRFTREAPAQWAALDKLELDGWQGPVAIDPVGTSNRDRGQRLRELVAELNEHLDQSLIHFRMDCEGQRITFDSP